MEEKIASNKALLFYVLDYCFKNIRVDFRGAAEYPEVSPVRVTADFVPKADIALKIDVGGGLQGR